MKCSHFPKQLFDLLIKQVNKNWKMLHSPIHFSSIHMKPLELTCWVFQTSAGFLHIKKNWKLVFSLVLCCWIQKENRGKVFDGTLPPLWLQLIHSSVVDTSVVFPHRLGLPYKRALKNLMADHLKRIIQDNGETHRRPVRVFKKEKLQIKKISIQFLILFPFFPFVFFKYWSLFK